MWLWCDRPGPARRRLSVALILSSFVQKNRNRRTAATRSALPFPSSYKYRSHQAAQRGSRTCGRRSQRRGRAHGGGALPGRGSAPRSPEETRLWQRRGDREDGRSSGDGPTGTAAARGGTCARGSVTQKEAEVPTTAASERYVLAGQLTRPARTQEATACVPYPTTHPAPDRRRTVQK